MGIIDRSWRHHLEQGEILERWQMGGYRVVMLRVTEQISVIYYHLRVLFFAEGPVPVFSANLESSLFHDARPLGVHTVDAHFNHGPAGPETSPQDFKRWALGVAGQYLGAGEKKVARGSHSETPPTS